MNDLYHWNAEMMVALEMEELKKEMDSIRLLHDAELSNPSIFHRMITATGNVLVKLGQRLCGNAEPHQAYQVTSSKFAA